MSEEKPINVEQLMFNGINGATGAYLLPPMSPRELSAIAQGDEQDEEHLSDLKQRYRKSTQTKRGVKAGIDPLNLASAGWGIIFAKEDSGMVPAIKEALGELLELRRSQGGERYREFNGEDGYQRGESYIDFLTRHGIGPGPADPERVPYYLLIVGDPEAIPFNFQYQLDVQYAVGRIYFDDIEHYARYAHSVVEMETGNNSIPRRAVFFGVQNQDDPATQLSATHLVQPLAEKLSDQQGEAPWEINAVIGEEATKTAFSNLLDGNHSPALLFSASHGMGFPMDDPRQIPHQGALLCQDWPGPQAWREAIPEDYYFSASDVPPGAHLSGSIAFHFACYGAGTPKMDDFAHQAFMEPKAIASQAFVAGLPQRLLSHPNGGMLAVIGHVERAWGYSFAWKNTGSQLAVFESALIKIMGGSPVGYAMEYFNERYAELSTILSAELHGVQFGKEVDDVELAGMWTANNDARSYVIIGDPAVHIPDNGSEQDQIYKEHASPVLLSEHKAHIGSITSDTAVHFSDPEPTEVESHPKELNLDLDGADQDMLAGLTLKKLDQLLKEGTALQKANLKFLIGNSFSKFHNGSGVDNLKSGISQYQSALKSINQDEHPDQWRRIKFNLAISFAKLYSLTGELHYMNLAEQANSAIIESLPHDEHLDYWSRANLNIAHLYTQMYNQSGEMKFAQQALEAYQKALGAITMESAPLDWAQTHYNLAKLQVDLFNAIGDERYRSGAMDDFHAALDVFEEELFPYQYVDANINIGNLYLAQGDSDQERSIELAIQAFQSAQEKVSRVADLIQESLILTKLGDAYAKRLQGDKTKNVFMATAYYKHSLAIMQETNDREGMEEINLKIKHLQSDQT